jgi:hypothetical protein
MAGAETTVERLRQFLRELSPGARSLLIGELERSVLRGDEVTGADLVLQELRRIVREQRDGASRIENSARLLFKPLEPFLVDDRGDRVGVDGTALAKASRLVAKVDSAAVQDGFDLYLHGFIVTDDGNWTVVQQGMNGARKQARRYHWLSEGLKSFVDDPHTAIEGMGQGNIINLADHRAEKSRRAQLDLLSSLGPDKITTEFAKLVTAGGAHGDPEQFLLPHLILPSHHDVRQSDVIARRLHANLAAAADRGWWPVRV